MTSLPAIPFLVPTSGPAYAAFLLMRMEEGRQSLEKRLRGERGMREQEQELESHPDKGRREKDEMEWNLLPLLSAQNRYLIG